MSTSLPLIVLRSLAGSAILFAESAIESVIMPVLNAPSNGTVPTAFVHRMLTGAKRQLSASDLLTIVRAAGISPDLLRVRMTRVTREQFTRLYAGIAIGTGDEMLGLWSRPIRAGALKYLGLAILNAPSLSVALYRFTRFWNLLLDDYRLELSSKNAIASVRLIARASTVPTSVFGHELMVKLIHGTVSWLGGRPVQVERVGFGFPCPQDFAEYSSLFPAQVAFNQAHTFICFSESVLRKRYQRTQGDLIGFVKGAPDDWIFLTLDQTSLVAKVRALIIANIKQDLSLESVSRSLRMSTRSLSRRLAIEGLTYRGIKNSLRRDTAIDRLVRTRESIAQIASQIGFDDVSAFHRAFRTWTGSTPKTYREQQLLA